MFKTKYNRIFVTPNGMPKNIRHFDQIDAHMNIWEKKKQTMGLRMGHRFVDDTFCLCT